jgi:methionyl-tRNA synthetase
MAETAFISTTIPYVNARPHLGHALEYVETDAYARHMASTGVDVYFLTGSDENSLKNVLAAEREGLSARELVDRNVGHFERLLAALGVEYRRFIRTSVDVDHLDGARLIWKRMENAGDIYPREYEGLYCVGCEQFYTPAELVDGKCPEHLVVPELVSETNYFFRLSRYAEPLLKALDAGEIRIVPQTRFNEVTSFIRAGLEDISISRSTGRARGWGIEVPDDPEHVMYVWIDALTNYTNALGWSHNADEYQHYWENAQRRIHVVGKGVLRFHAVYWPAMLMSAGLPMPTEIVVHGYITASGQKISKSLGNAVDPAELIDLYGVNAVRYFLLADFSPFTDRDFFEERLVSRYNTDLANGLGNLVSRATSMTLRYRTGIVPTAVDPGPPEASLAEQVVASESGSLDAMAGYDHKQALTRIWDLVRRTNAYVDERAPWKLAKAAEAGGQAASEALDTTLHHLVAAVRQLGALISPFLPGPGSAILEAVGSSPSSVPRAASWLEGIAGSRVTKPPAIFPRLEVPEAQQ